MASYLDNKWSYRHCLLDQTIDTSPPKTVERIPVRLVAAGIHASLQLALEHDIYAYDAYFLQCAQAFSCPLLS